MTLTHGDYHAILKLIVTFNKEMKLH